MRCFISGGAPLPLHIVQAYQARGVVFKQGYGLTEVGVNCFAMTVEDSVRKAGSVGRPLMFTEARLVGEDGREAGVGEVGELCFRGSHVCSGYWNQPEATAEGSKPRAGSTPATWRGAMPRASSTSPGRRRRCSSRGGVNVYPAEIENELLQHPAVRDAAVVGRPDDTGARSASRSRGPAGAAGARAEAVADSSRRGLPATSCRALLAVEALPRTAYGKVVKGQLARHAIWLRPGLRRAVGRTRNARHSTERVMAKPVYIAAYHQSKFGKLMGMTVPDIIATRSRERVP